MSSTQHHCTNERRRVAVQNYRDQDGLPRLNGIDYLEVAADPKTLLVYFIHPLRQNPEEPLLSAENLRIAPVPTASRPVVSPMTVEVESVSVWGNRLTLTLDRPGQVMPYLLRLVRSPIDKDNPDQPPPGFDHQLSQVEFTFRSHETSEVDCEATTATSEPGTAPPAIDYLAKDFASFRQLMLDRLAVTMPAWTERSPADVGNLLVELVAYVADHLSYFQDAVATEAYLGTARRRSSVRRHARLLNYTLNDGRNARVWLSFQVSEAVSLPQPTPGNPGIQFLTRLPGLPALLSPKDYAAAIATHLPVFEPLHAARFFPACNEMRFYTWGDATCTLPAGTTAATLDDRHGTLASLLKPGIVLLLEEVKGSDSGDPLDADRNHRHLVRLTQVNATEDPLFGLQILEIQWHPDDALPFPLVIAKRIGDRPLSDFSVARGNILLADHGRTIVAAEQQHLGTVAVGERFRPRLPEGPLTQQGKIRTAQGKFVVFDATLAAAKALLEPSSPMDPMNSLLVQPAILLEEQGNDPNLPPHRWQPQKDLLNSSRFAREFVVEPQEDGRVMLRFGDGEQGRRPTPGHQFTAIYRVGNGTAGNVGAGAIAHAYTADPTLAATLRNALSGPSAIANPLPAVGGLDPEPLDQVRLYAPQQFKTLQRAVTEADYADIAQRFPGVAKALATRRWTGSWYTIFITVDRQDGLPVDAAFKRELRAFLERFRLTGHDLEIESPRFVPLDLAFQVQVLPDYFRAQVRDALVKSFSKGVLENGQLGFFHPNNFSFGQPLYLSRAIATAMQVVGVESVVVTRFQRLGLDSNEALERGQISFGRLEIAQLDNDPSAPEKGRITFNLEGGR